MSQAIEFFEKYNILDGGHKINKSNCSLNKEENKQNIKSILNVFNFKPNAINLQEDISKKIFNEGDKKTFIGKIARQNTKLNKKSSLPTEQDKNLDSQHNTQERKVKFISDTHQDVEPNPELQSNKDIKQNQDNTKNSKPNKKFTISKVLKFLLPEIPK